jgi:hypothetical protein
LWKDGFWLSCMSWQIVTDFAGRKNQGRMRYIVQMLRFLAIMGGSLSFSRERNVVIINNSPVKEFLVCRSMSRACQLMREKWIIREVVAYHTCFSVQLSFPFHMKDYRFERSAIDKSEVVQNWHTSQGDSFVHVWIQSV